jgi:hypothetical protein
LNESQLGNCPFCYGRNTLIQEGTKLWTGMRYGPPTHYEVNHWCEDKVSRINLRAKTEQEVINKWNRTPNAI